MPVAAAQADWPLPYWPGVVVAHSIYAIFEARRWSNFQKYKEVCSYLFSFPNLWLLGGNVVAADGSLNSFLLGNRAAAAPGPRSSAVNL